MKQIVTSVEIVHPNEKCLYLKKMTVPLFIPIDRQRLADDIAFLFIQPTTA